MGVKEMIPKIENQKPLSFNEVVIVDRINRIIERINQFENKNDLQP